MKQSLALLFVSIATLAGCAVSPAGDEGPSVANESAAKKPQTGDCVCSGGHMSESYCTQFGAPWTSLGDACVWPAKSKQGALTAEQCQATGVKHSGDGSGRDIYNLGITCSIQSPADCRTKGCPSGQHCDVCRTTSGPAYVCLPDGAVC